MNGDGQFEAGERIGRYRIVKTIGSGSSGTVYEAIDERLDRAVAIKVAAVTDPLVEGDEQTSRFTREARFAASLSHPNLCPVYDFGRHEGRPYLVMALLPGATLADLIARHAPLPADRIVVLVRPIAEALAEMHRVGLVHGDVKPQNILLDARLEPMVTDYGLARPEKFVGRALPSQAGLATPGTATGSPAFQSPEQLQASSASGAPFVAGPRLGPAVDMHALGVILYMLLTGRLPFAGSPEETVQKILESPPEAPSRIATGVSRDLEQICLRLLRKNPAERPSAIEVARRLRLIADRGGAPLGRWSEASDSSTEPAGEAGAEKPTSTPADGASERARRGPSMSAAVALVALLLLPIVGYALYAYVPWTHVPWERIAEVLPSSLSPAPQSDSESSAEPAPGSGGTAAGSAAVPGAERGSGPAERLPAANGGSDADRMEASSTGASRTGASRAGASRTASPSSVSVEEFDPELASAPARLFVAGGRVVVSAAVLPAAAEGNAVAWWPREEWPSDEPSDDQAADEASGEEAFERGRIRADSLVPARQGGRIAGVLTSGSGETVGILGESWYGRVAASGGSVATNPVSGWLTVEQAATSPSGRFALLQKTGLENRKRIGVWDVADGANPTALMAIYTDDATTAVALSPNGRGLAFGDSRGRVMLRPVSDEGNVLAELSVAGPVTAVAFSADNLRLTVAHRAPESGAAGSETAAGITIFQYESAEWSELQRISLEGAVARHLIWSADGTWLGGVLEPSGPSPAANSATTPAAGAAPDPRTPLPFARLWPLEQPAAAVRIPDVAGTAIGFVGPGSVLVGHGDGLVRRWELQ